MIAVVSVSVFIVSFLCLWFLYLGVMGHRNCFVCHAKQFIKSISAHYSVDFHGKGRVLI